MLSLCSCLITGVSLLYLLTFVVVSSHIILRLFFLRLRRPPRSTQSRSSAASDVYKRQGEIWQGKVLPQDVELSNRRIREALTGEKFDLFTKNLMDQLPSCDASQRYLWEKVPVKGWDDADLPACRPDPELLAQARERFKSDFLKEVPERVVLVKASTFSQEDLSWVSKLSSLTYLLLFVPLLFVLLGAWLAFPGLVPFLRGLGFFGILAGGLSWLGAWFLKTIISWSSTPLRFFSISSKRRLFSRCFFLR